MFGKPGVKRLLGRIRRIDFIVGTGVAGISALCLISFALYDSVHTARIKDRQFQRSTLKGQLAEFLLTTREPDGSSLLENPGDFSKTERPLRIISLKRPFFSYFLNRGNARVFKTDDIRWDAPRSCILELARSSANDGNSPASSIQACFAAISGDVSGRYVYFSLRYPSPPVRRHVPGTLAADGDRVLLRFVGNREAKLTLVFEPPPLAKASFPSQMQRFDGLHEVTGFFSDEAGRSSRYVNAQAYQLRAEDGSQGGETFVTVAGRINASALPGGEDVSSAWPTDLIKSLSIGVEVYSDFESSNNGKPAFSFVPGAKGTALVSIEKAYLATVSTRANLEVSVPNKQNEPILVWRSADAGFAALPRRTGWPQQVSDWWANILVSGIGYKIQPLQVQQQQIVSGMPVFTASLTTDPNILPDVATRAFGWLTAALGVVAVLCGHWIFTLIRLGNITRTAYAMTLQRADGSLTAYSASKGQIGTLGRVFHLLISRNRASSARQMKRLSREQALRLEGMRLAEERVKARHAILDTIAHEIRSPLQSLLNRTSGQSELHPLLERMRRAVEALYEATSVQTGLANGDIVLKRLDLAAYLSKLANNLCAQGKSVTYLGPAEAVPAVFDPITLEQLLDNVINNALRYRRAETAVVIQVQQQLAGHVTIEVFNYGQEIPPENMEEIFSYGVSDFVTPESRGLGLFTARNYALAMQGTIRAENRGDGVAFLITLPTNAGEI